MNDDNDYTSDECWARISEAQDAVVDAVYRLLILGAKAASAKAAAEAASAEQALEILNEGACVLFANVQACIEAAAAKAYDEAEDDVVSDLDPVAAAEQILREQG